jgi:5-methylcytosine-specific restriction enzyme subunit McrC
MTDDKGILIKNIYYMLTYAYQVLRQTNYKEIAGEDFENIHDLFAAILFKGVAQQLKQGLYREYVTKTESLPVMRGKLNLPGTINNELQRKQELSCEYDELSVNNLCNRILKTAMVALVRQKTVSAENKAALRRVLPFFGLIDIIEPCAVKWSTIWFQRSNQNYRMLINICYFILDGMLLSTDNGKYKMAEFSDEHMHRLYEHFILAYYKYHFKLIRSSSAQIHWNLDDGKTEFLPIMQTDITLEHRGRVLIIDAKYYGKTMQTHFDKHTIHSGNLYQIFTYVKNRDKGNTGEVGGILLYAKTQESITPDSDFVMGGSKISVKTLDLNLPFMEISRQLNKIVKDFFGDCAIAS